MAEETRKAYLTEDGEVLEPGAGAAPTRRVEEIEVASTIRVSEEELTLVETERAPDAPRLPLGTLPPGSMLCSNCVVEHTLHPHESQRPGLFLCQAPEGKVVVKVAATRYPPRRELWERLIFLRHPHVLRTHRTDEEDGLFYEVQEYCDAGTLEARVPRHLGAENGVTAEWISEQLVPQLAAALSYLHEQEIIHRDIKPANVYIKTILGNELLVLGDFDISSVLELSQTSRDTTRTAGTWYYTAPEAFPRFVDDTASNKRGRISRASDYFSLGITIIELLIGTTSLHQCELPDLFDFYLQGNRVEIPQGIPGRLTLLLRGLLIRNRQTRWGAEEIARWLRDANSDDDLKKIHDDEYYELARASRPYRLKDYFAVDLPSLAEAMFHEPEIAIEDLIAGDVLLNWVGNLDPTVAREIRRDRDKHFLQPEMVLWCAIMRCDPTRPFIFSDGFEVQTSIDWLKHAIELSKRGIIRKESFTDTSLLLQFATWLRMKSEPEIALADAVEPIRESPAEVQLEELLYLFQPNRAFEIMKGVAARTPQELVQLAYGKTEQWKVGMPACYEAAFKRWQEGGLNAWLRQRRMGKLSVQIDEVRENLAEEPYAAFETILRLLDPALPPVVVELDLSEVAPRVAIHYDTVGTYRLRYTTLGRGIPLGALLLEARKGVRLKDTLINAREGVIDLVIDARADMPIDRIFNVTIKLDAGFTVLKGAPLHFQFKVLYPSLVTAHRLLSGMGLGLALLGIPRFLMWLQGWEGTVTLRKVLNGPPNGDTILVSGLLLLIAAGYAGLWLWTQAIRRSE